MGIRPGDGIAPLSDFLVLPNGRYAAKAWDDRVGLAVMIVAARRIRAEGIRLPAQVLWVATTQEEIGLRGAQTAVDAAKPDLGISIEAVELLIQVLKRLDAETVARVSSFGG